MILIYASSSTKRLQYICKFIFAEVLGIAYSITIDKDSFISHKGEKITYCDHAIDDSFHIQQQQLLFEKDIREQSINCFEINGYKAFYKTSAGDYPFDIFSASFYLLSRYEEYLPHTKDIYNRYDHQNSLAFKEGFLQTPLINIWLQDFLKKLQVIFPAMPFHLPDFNFKPTYDIDIAWSYKNKGLLRNIGGFIRHPSMERLSVLAGLQKDPFNCYEYLNQLHHENKLEPIYFFLVATSRSQYDKNISPYTNSMWQLIRFHAKKYDIGLHPSFKSNDNLVLLKKERKIIETAARVAVTKSRQHYIKFTLPETMEKLVEAGIENDYSMGYGSINGFRASVASSFYWYNLKKEIISRLRIHPFCFMDANSFYEQKQSAEQSLEELNKYFEICKKVNGTLITIFHNNFLGSDKQFDGWKEMYSQFISQVPR